VNLSAAAGYITHRFTVDCFLVPLASTSASAGPYLVSRQVLGTPGYIQFTDKYRTILPA